MAELFGIVAKSNATGATASAELVFGREKAAETAQELIESDHTVQMYRCVAVDFEVVTKTTVVLSSD